MVSMMVISHKSVAKRWPLPKQLQVGKSQSNKPAVQPFQHFSQAATTTIVSAIQLCKASAQGSLHCIVAQCFRMQMSHSVSEMSSVTLLLFLHCELEHLSCPLDLHHLACAIIFAIQFCKAWTAFITS
jgi:hypothetical protein